MRGAILVLLFCLLGASAPAHALPFFDAQPVPLALEPGGPAQTIDFHAVPDGLGLSAVLLVVSVDPAALEILSVDAGADFTVTFDPIGSPGEVSLDALFLDGDVYSDLYVGSITLRALPGAAPGPAAFLSPLSTLVDGSFQEFGPDLDVLAEVLPIPEPETAVLALGGLGALAAAARSQRTGR